MPAMNADGGMPIRDPPKTIKVARKHPMVPAYPGSLQIRLPIYTRTVAMRPPGIPKQYTPQAARSVPADASGDETIFPIMVPPRISPPPCSTASAIAVAPTTPPSFGRAKIISTIMKRNQQQTAAIRIWIRDSIIRVVYRTHRPTFN